MIAVIIMYSLFALVCLLGLGQNLSSKKGTGFFTGLGCLIGFGASLLLLTKRYEEFSKEDKQEIPIEQVENIKQTTDTINIKIVVEYE